MLQRNARLQRWALAGLAQNPAVFRPLLAIHVGAAQFEDLCSWRLLDFGRVFLRPKTIRMNVTTRWVRTICVIGAVIAPAVNAEELTVDLDPNKTSIAFVLSDVLHTVRGEFRLKTGHILFNPGTDAMAGEIVVDASSGYSGSNARDKRMKRDILEAEHYPDIRFTPTKKSGSISMPGTSNVDVTGSFLIHGQAHEITIPMQLQMSQDEVTATGKFIIPYVQWGMKNPSNFLLKVNNKVEIDLKAVGHLGRP